MSVFNCPYCGSSNDFTEDLPSGGRVTVDCEVCCRPIVVQIKRGEISVRAENQ